MNPPHNHQSAFNKTTETIVTESNPYQTPESSSKSANPTKLAFQEELEKILSKRNNLVKAIAVFAVILGALLVSSSGAIRGLDMLVLGGGIVACTVQAGFLTVKMSALKREIDQPDSA